jgi:hypothetical protein
VARGIARYGGCLARERFGRNRAESTDDIPVTGGEVTREWLTAVLCDGHPGAEVVSFHTEDVSAGTSTRWKVTLAYNEVGREAGLPTRLFAKTTVGFRQRLTQELADILEGEPGFFRYLRPELDIEAARGYFGAADRKTGRSISLIEDISASKGAVFSTPQTSISREQMEGLLANMASWHGRYWNSPALTGKRWMKLPRDHYANLDRLISMEKCSKVGVKRARERVPDPLVAAHDHLYVALKKSLDMASEKPLTLLHGDSHIGNTYQTAAGRMGFTDWQVVMRGQWAYDVSYTISSGLTVENRRAWERDLLAFYLDRLAAAGGSAPSFESAWLDYRRQTLYPYFCWLTTMGHSKIMPRMQPYDICRVIIERTGNAVHDLDALGAVG